jgi:hypothetical protein
LNEGRQAADSTVDDFLTGKTAMIHNGFWVIPQYANDKDRTFLNFRPAFRKTCRLTRF